MERPTNVDTRREAGHPKARTPRARHPRAPGMTVGLTAVGHDQAVRAAVGPRTRPTYTGLLMRGLTVSQAATLTGYVAGIPVGQMWTLREVNQLLFLRALDQRGAWAAGDAAVER